MIRPLAESSRWSNPYPFDAPAHRSSFAERPAIPPSSGADDFDRLIVVNSMVQLINRL